MQALKRIYFEVRENFSLPTDQADTSAEADLNKVLLSEGRLDVCLVALSEVICERCGRHPAIAQVPKRDGGVMELCRFCFDELGLSVTDRRAPEKRQEDRDRRREDRRQGERRQPVDRRQKPWGTALRTSGVKLRFAK